ncbi:hypothetical protein V9T40_013246 [Parthenolecanium corni]|uniref:Uncharacterized protein n=1 Tax=Parthenolecanium corni TaxID=536013 RepID=A0AAN9TN69_9HEMI
MISIEKSNSEELFAVSNPDEVLRRRYAKNNASLLQQSTEISDHMLSVSRRLADVVKENSGTLETLVVYSDLFPILDVCNWYVLENRQETNLTMEQHLSSS